MDVAKWPICGEIMRVGWKEREIMPTRDPWNLCQIEPNTPT